MASGGAALLDRLRAVPRATAGDATAGVSVALVLIPQSMAYAVLAGMPPATGLAVGGVTALAAAPFASSPVLQTGPSAIMSLLAFGSLAAMADAGTSEYVALAALLTLMVGAIKIGVGATRSGEVAFLLSEPVIAGFTSSAGIVIAASQLPKVVGVAEDGQNVAIQTVTLLARIDDWQLEALAFGVATVVIMQVATRIHPLIPGVLIAVVVGVALVRLVDIDVALVGEIPEGFPGLQLAMPWGDARSLIAPALIIALIGFSPVVAVARAYDDESAEPWDADREFIGQGAANIASGLVGGFPVGGSLSRTAVNEEAGADTAWSGAVTGVATLAALPFAGVLEALPEAVLGGIIIGAVLSLMDPRPVWELRRYSRQQFVVASVTFVLTLVLAPQIQWAVLVGIVLAIGGHLRRERNLSVAHWNENGELHVRPVGVLYFASARRLEEEIRELADQHRGVAAIVVHLDMVGRIDITAAYSIRDLLEQARARGYDVEVADLAEPGRRIVAPVLEHADDLEMEEVEERTVEEDEPRR